MKIKALFFLALSASIISSCVNPSISSPNGTGNYSPPNDIKASVTPTSSSSPSSLNIGILPDNSNSPEEQKISGILNRQVIANFPLKIGVLLYNSSTNILEKTRQDLYNNFVNSLKVNTNVSSVQDIPSSLLIGSKNIEDIRKLAARFQVSTLFIIDDRYKSSEEDKTYEISPIDVIRGVKNWVSQTDINILAFDIPSGVFIATGSTTANATDKYDKDSDTSKNKNDLLDKESASKAWTLLNDKVNQQINDLKNKFSNPVPTPITNQASNL
ncbi:MAG: hypothetical protein H7263_12310 [Candidatus Sericytochromatia bacterium]|nr:hypothetical protein [Candidatus Sericytochromatia bacterium]